MTARAAPPKKRDWSLRSRAVRGLFYQVAALGLIALGIWFLAHNTVENMRVRGIQSGFDFLTDPAGFDIGELMMPYGSSVPRQPPARPASSTRARRHRHDPVAFGGSF